MKNIPSLLSFFVLAALSYPVFAFASPEAKILNSEFDRLYAYVHELTPDGTVDGFLKYKRFDAYEILWNLEKDGNSFDIITLYREEFAVRFYKSRYIVDNRKVLRRFIGPHITGWRNDTVDDKTGEYLGSQGVAEPIWSEEDQSMLNEWKIKLIK